MDIKNILFQYDKIKEQGLADRFFKHSDILRLISTLPDKFIAAHVGESAEGKSIHLIKWGNGPVKVFLWSQMHGDEATGTMALFDLFNFLKNLGNKDATELDACTLFCLPMVNPDGAERFMRRNSQQVDINRDYLAINTPEGKLLKSLRENLCPDFGFNLHDQNTLWSVKGQNLPATLSFLAPAASPALEISETRENSMLVIADIFQDLRENLPGQIGLFDEEFEPRAFGDNFQKAGTSTILIEAGGLKGDQEKQQIRKYFFLSILSGLKSICTGSYLKQQLRNYSSIPPNNKKLFHLIAHNVQANGILCSISLNYEEELKPDKRSVEKIWSVHDAGDLTGWNAYTILNEKNYFIESRLLVGELANFDLFCEGKIILAFKNGILVHSSLKLN